MSSAVDFIATGKSCHADKENRTTGAETQSSQPSVFSSLSEAALGQVQGEVDSAQGRETCHARHICNYPHPLQDGLDRALAGLYTKWQGTAWQSTHAGGSPMPEAACSTWRQIKPAWCPATTVNMPGQERQGGLSPTKIQSNKAIAWLLQWQWVLKKSG